MSDLAARITKSFNNPKSDPWFPGLTNDLVSREWRSLQPIGLTPITYGTSRFLCRSASVPRHVIAAITPSSLSKEQSISIETVQSKSSEYYRDAGVTFYSPDELQSSAVRECIEDAMSIIGHVPSLIATVGTLVRSLHAIRPADEYHDVSFSEPHIPFSIFVSVPQKRVANDTLRVAEAIVHEAMHLQLSLIEKSVVLSVSSKERIYSPWKGEHRTAQGVLHGLYVFRVIHQLLVELSSMQQFSDDNWEYITGRRKEIARQICSIRDFEKSVTLTEAGSSLARILSTLSTYAHHT
jgi:HEXXH motif-containing protein